MRRADVTDADPRQTSSVVLVNVGVTNKSSELMRIGSDTYQRFLEPCHIHNLVRSWPDGFRTPGKMSEMALFTPRRCYPAEESISVPRLRLQVGRASSDQAQYNGQRKPAGCRKYWTPDVEIKYVTRIHSPCSGNTAARAGVQQ
jgi:hypothetical protein